MGESAERLPDDEVMAPEAGLSAFLEAVAAKSPSPGGGAVAAACGALSAAMGRMVAVYSPGKGAGDDAREAAVALSAQLVRIDQMMRRLLVEDAEAYPAMVAAERAFKVDPGVRGAYEVAVGVAIAIPLEIMATAGECLSVLGRLRGVASLYLLSDLAVAGILAEACVRAGSRMVLVNLDAVGDAGERTRIRAEVSGLLSRAGERFEALESSLG